MKDVVMQVTGFLMVIMLFLGTLNVKFNWLTEESISAFGVVLSAGIALVVTLYTIYKNHYGFTDRAKEQKKFLERNKKL
ncbi:phage holin [Mesobacillus subterraneus]|uniref:phage holin n=1 Tax=Mesobacillus subterraneus TaxID=285983 RepID=UPI00273E3D31|nr:phage holin [Mesobacillus subterraneus]WLR54278.1 phage holin [Mesobacillus subterraneus]